MMLLWASASWISRSPGPTMWPMTDTFVACPAVSTMASSVPSSAASSASSSWCTGFSPDSSRLDDTELP